MLVAFVVKVELNQQPATANTVVNPEWIKRQWTEAVIGRLEEELVRQPSTDPNPTKQNFIDRFEPHPDFQPVIFRKRLLGGTISTHQKPLFSKNRSFFLVFVIAVIESPKSVR
jgi:hypothetical protein